MKLWISVREGPAGGNTPWQRHLPHRARLMDLQSANYISDSVRERRGEERKEEEEEEKPVSPPKVRSSVTRRYFSWAARLESIFYVDHA